MGTVRYPYHYGYNCMDRIIGALGAYETDRFLVVTDDFVQGMHGDKLVPELERHAPVCLLSLPPGEGMKSMASLSGHLERALEQGATRRSIVVAFGGGVPGNLAGTLAAMLFRGIRLVHVPTTTVAAMDSVISSKQAVNSGRGKNQIGSYHIPHAVYTDLQLLQTLPERELRSGLCEASKNCLAIRPESLPHLRQVLADGDLSSIYTLLWLLKESLAAKLAVTSGDPKEQHSGLLLEYGHTIGHALEMCDQRLRGPERLSHGEAVACGMVAAARLSSELGGLSDEAVAVHDELAIALGVPLQIPNRFPVQDIVNVVRADNKRGYLNLGQDEAAFVLLRDMGRPFGSRHCPLVAVPLHLVSSVIATLASSGPNLVGA